MARERDRQRMSLSAFSRAVTRLAEGARGTSRTALRNLEEGRVDSPSKEVVEAAAAVLGVQEAWLWTGEPPRFRPDTEAHASPSAPAAPSPRPDRRPSARLGARLERAAAPTPGVPPRVPTDHAAWGPGVARTIAAECVLAGASDPVRTRFWSILETAADAPATAVRGPDDLLSLARNVDAAVVRPLDLLRPGQRAEGPWFESYALGLLSRVEAALDGGGATAPGSRIAEGRDGQRGPGVPLSLRGAAFSARRERDGLTWRLM